MLKRIVEKIEKKNLIKKGEKIILGFSGGPDSIFLLEVLLEHKKRIGFEIILAHINHLLRGEEAEEDEKFVYKVSKKYKLKVYVKRVEVKKIAMDQKKGLEEIGREVRYQFFNEILEKESADKIAIAHNLDDQIETFLFRLIRGSSIEGLKGIPNRDKIIRPINEIYKDEILKYLNSNNIEYRLDKTNFENEFTRNSIRLDLIPFIEQRYNPNFKEKIKNIFEEIRDINLIFEDMTKKYRDLSEIDIDILLEENIYIQKRVLNSFIKKHNVEANKEKIDNILELLKTDGTKEISLGNNKVLKKVYNKIKVEEKKDFECTAYKYELEIPFKIKYGDYLIETIDNSQKIEYDSFSTNLKKGDLIIIRNRKSGDKMIPLGMKNHKKIKDIFINEKIPKEERDRVPIVEHNDEIVWIVGVKKSEKFKRDKENGITLIARRQNEV